MQGIYLAFALRVSGSRTCPLAFQVVGAFKEATTQPGEWEMNANVRVIAL